MLCGAYTLMGGITLSHAVCRSHRNFAANPCARVRIICTVRKKRRFCTFAVYTPEYALSVRLYRPARRSPLGRWFFSVPFAILPQPSGRLLCVTSVQPRPDASNVSPERYLSAPSSSRSSALSA